MLPCLGPPLALVAWGAPPAGAVIRPEARDATVVERPPEPLDVDGGPERAAHLAPAADLVLLVAGMREVMRGHLGPDRPAVRARSMAWAMAGYSATWGRASLQAPRSARPPAVSSVSSTSMMSMSSQ